MVLVFGRQAKLVGHTLVGIDQDDKAYYDYDEVEQWWLVRWLLVL